MVALQEFLSELQSLVPLIRTFVIIVILLIVFNFILTHIKKQLLKHSKSKKQISNVKIFTKIFRYSVYLLIITFSIFSYTGSWTGLGVTIGLLSAALGWALQKPITGFAAWIMLVTKRPFDIGDRIIIENVRGDVSDITLTHVYIKEIGGIVAGEERSGRIIMVPNSILFEKNIINYTAKDEFVLDQVIVPITFESDLDKALIIIMQSAKKYLMKLKPPEPPYIRTFFRPDGMGVHIRYFSPATHLQEYTSKITKEIYDRIRKSKNIDIAYPQRSVHMDSRLS